MALLLYEFVFKNIVKNLLNDWKINKILFYSVFYGMRAQFSDISSLIMTKIESNVWNIIQIKQMNTTLH